MLAVGRKAHNIAYKIRISRGGQKPPCFSIRGYAAEKIRSENTKTCRGKNDCFLKGSVSFTRLLIKYHHIEQSKYDELHPALTINLIVSCFCFIGVASLTPPLMSSHLASWLLLWWNISRESHREPRRKKDLPARRKKEMIFMWLLSRRTQTLLHFEC